MRKLVVLTGILFLVLGMVAVTQVSATDITQFDNLTATSAGVTGDPTQLAWWNNTNESGETEPGTITGNVWDLKSFNNVNSGKDLTLNGGYNFKSGQDYGGTTYTTGSLFISTTGKPLFGEASPDLSYVGGTSGNAQIKNNFGYNYVVTFTFGTGAAGTYQVYAIDSTAVLLKTSYLDPESFLDTNPWKYNSGGTTGSSGTLNFAASGSDYVLTLAGLLGLPEFANANDIWLHYTYQCGNDTMVGETLGSNVPIPGSVLLLGTGLLGLVGLRFRRS